jgi:chromosome segregation ATPase
MIEELSEDKNGMTLDHQSLQKDCITLKERNESLDIQVTDLTGKLQQANEAVTRIKDELQQTNQQLEVIKEDANGEHKSSSFKFLSSLDLPFNASPAC